MKRSNHYYNDRGLKMFLQDADGMMYFSTIEGIDSLELNTRNQRCVKYNADDVMGLTNDMVLVLYDKTEQRLMFLEKWRLYFLDEVNIHIENGDVMLHVPYKLFNLVGGDSTWIDMHATNVTWKSIEDNIVTDEIPKNLSDQINLYNYAVKEKRSS